MSGGKFVNKEFREILKTYKIWVVPLIFVFFGFLSPITTKLLPEILKSQMKAQNIALQLPQPSALESFSQYFKNLSQIGALAVILLSMGLVSEEKAKGTLHLILTKPVSRNNVILSKFLAQSVLMVCSVIVGAIICYLYTWVLFGEGSLKPFSQSIVMYAVYYELLIAITLFFSTLFSNQIAAGGAALISLFALTVLPSISGLLAKYSPYTLAISADKIIKSEETIRAGGWPILVSLVLIAVFLVFSCVVFRRQEL
jgi:ABC-2 type transport system permease protein